MPDPMNSKPLEVMGKAEFDCTRCGGRMKRLALLTLAADGSVDMNTPAELAGRDICNGCIEHDNEQEKASRRAREERKRWPNKTPKLVGSDDT